MTHIWNLPFIETIRLKDIEDKRDVALITTANAFEVVADDLHIRIRSSALVQDATLEHWDSLPVNGDVVYAVGGGLAVDGAKYVAKKHNLPLVCIPTALTVDAFLTWASGYRHDGCVSYIETKPPDTLYIDYAMLGRAPDYLRAAGICDVLSIATGLWDWRFAHEKGKNPANMPYIAYVDTVAQGILQGALDCAESAGFGEMAGLRQLLECLALEVQLCNFIGHSRPEEGSEHYFAYAVENVMGKGLPHGDLVSPGILYMAERQGQDTQRYREALMACHQRLDKIPPSVVEQTFVALPAYCDKHKLPFGIAHTL